ncbi:multidrug ABC transporter substrate-binding protein [Candidatus Peregrinibacteria bacterium CG10_big_fil_rev_8_21_14_0_10_49_10]|nr:MAG: multidrug ABC transporter substrate-binding protein [Candidatus Peregrinibacteria bacterium CG10_big_fil_rev_8_21_14_0_10_49_10]
MLYILENIRSAFDAIRSNKLRSGLTMLGVIIGVSSVVLMVGIGKGSQQAVTERIQSLGTNLLMVRPGSPSQSNVRSLFRRSGGGSSSTTLSTDDVTAIREHVPGIAHISPELSGNMQAIVGNLNMQTNVIGATPEYVSVNNFDVAFGSFITDEHLVQRQKVVVLGQEVVRTLFGEENPIGKDMRLENHIFTVIGIMEEKGQQGFSNQDDVAFIPLSTMQQRVQGTDKLSSINISVAKQEEMERVKTVIESAVLSRHRITNPADQDFNVVNQADAVETLNEVTQTFTFLLGGIAAISLLVGGIGVMNIMLVSVTERTREIGIRKAIGAKKRDILQQFLVESMVLSVLGGGIGVLLSYMGAWLVSHYAQTKAIISLNSIFLAFSFSIAIGIFFGILPAWKAAKLKPIDALRYE